MTAFSPFSSESVCRHWLETLPEKSPYE